MRLAWLLVLGACGRFGFAALPGDGRDDGRDDGITPRDVGVDVAPPSLCATSTALMCDGFEDPQFDATRWEFDNFDGMIELDTTRAYRGSQSAHIQTFAISSAVVDPRATLYTYQNLGNVTGVVYVRAWAYFASPNPTTFFDQLLNFTDDAGNGISFGARNGFIVDNDYTSAGYAQSLTTLLPLDRWTCLELAIPSGTTGTVRLYVDGAEVTDAALAKTTAQPKPTHIYIGLEWLAGTVMTQPAVDAWFDELVVDSNPTTCAE